MSPPDSEGKCQCQHCDGKQSARECLCDSVGVTSTIDESQLQTGKLKKKKSPETSSQSSQAFQAPRLWVGTQRAGGDLASTTPQCNFDVEWVKKREEKEKTKHRRHGFAKGYYWMIWLIGQIKAGLMCLLRAKIREDGHQCLWTQQSDICDYNSQTLIINEAGGFI